jgi:adenine-specific DNA-methyltransferase
VSEELLRAKLTWGKLRKAQKLLDEVDKIEQFEANRFDKIKKKVHDCKLIVTGEKKVTQKTEGLGGSFSYVTLGPEMSLEKLLAEGLPTFEALAKYVFFTATGRTLERVPKQNGKSLGFIGDTDLYRVHLLYKPEQKWLASNDAALTETLVDQMIEANTAKKKVLIFAASKFMGQRELTRKGVEFCQLPFAIHRILGE